VRGEHHLDLLIPHLNGCPERVDAPAAGQPYTGATRKVGHSARSRTETLLARLRRGRLGRSGHYHRGRRLLVCGLALAPWERSPAAQSADGSAPPSTVGGPF
jgi:hypothetical protein